MRGIGYCGNAITASFNNRLGHPHSQRYEQKQRQPNRQHRADEDARAEIMAAGHYEQKQDHNADAQADGDKHVAVGLSQDQRYAEEQERDVEHRLDQPGVNRHTNFRPEVEAAIVEALNEVPRGRVLSPTGRVEELIKLNGANDKAFVWFEPGRVARRDHGRLAGGKLERGLARDVARLGYVLKEETGRPICVGRLIDSGRCCKMPSVIVQLSRQHEVGLLNGLLIGEQLACPRIRMPVRLS